MLAYAKKRSVLMSFKLPTSGSTIQKESMNKYSSTKKTIAIMSGKGGVGKSTATSLIASSLAKEGYKVGILDADITGPSIPKLFKIEEKGYYTPKGISSIETENGIRVMSINLLLENEDDPVIWRAALITQTIKQFYSEVDWGELDYLLIDLPPGTGDVPLTIMQSIKLDGIVIVSTPQDLVKMVVKKSVNMAKTMNIPVLGLVENMAYLRCPDTNRIYDIFGEGKAKTVADELELKIIGRLPLDPDLVKLSDIGRVYDYLNLSTEYDEHFHKTMMEVL
jgi:Mrp family chromosome partitioning ATPase